MIVHMRDADIVLVKTWISLRQNQFHTETIISAQNAELITRCGKKGKTLLREILYTAGIVDARYG